MALLLISALAAYAQSNDEAPAKNTGLAGSRGGPSKPWTPTYISDGQPDWQGFWEANPRSDTYDITGTTLSPSTPQDTTIDPDGARTAGIHRVTGTADGRIPYQPWAAAHHQDISDNVTIPTKPKYIDTQARCLLDGPGRAFIHSGFEIVQAPGYIVFLTEENDEQIIVPLDGRPHIGKDISLWQGDRRGHWEGNTLVVDITNLKAKSRLDMSGNFYGPGTHFVERFTRLDENTIQYQATVMDPAVYTQPWMLNIRFGRAHLDDPAYELWEDACHEGERSADNMVISPEAKKIIEDAAAKAQAAKQAGKQ